jgi:hypothetical protein
MKKTAFKKAAMAGCSVLIVTLSQQQRRLKSQAMIGFAVQDEGSMYCDDGKALGDFSRPLPFVHYIDNWRYRKLHSS